MMSVSTKLPGASEPVAPPPLLLRPAVFLGAVWTLMTGSTLVLSFKFGLTSPFSDEWRWVPLICGRETFTAEWFFRSENQHHMPLAKAAYIGLGWLTRFDFRAGAISSVVILALLALALMFAAARVRGRASEVDAVFPLLLLNWGQYHNLMMGSQFYYVVNCVLAGVILLTIMASREKLSLAVAMVTLLCLIGLAGSGGGGIAYAPPIMLWLVYAGWARLCSRDRGDRRSGAAILALALLPALLVIWYFAFPESILGVAGQQPHHLRTSLVGAIQFLSISGGRLGRDLWPFSGLLTVALLLTAGIWLGVVAWRRPQERVRALGLGFFLVAVLSVAVGIGLTRAQLGPTYCLTARYITLACPLGLCLCVIACLYGPAIRRRGTRWAVVGIMLVITVIYTRNGIHNAADLQAPIQRMERVVRSGLPLSAVASRSFVDVQSGSAEALTEYLIDLRGARLGPYRFYERSGPERQVLVVPLSNTAGNAAGAAPMGYSGAGVLRQSFTAEAALPLYQIEFRARGNVRDRWAARSFHWSLEQVPGSGPRRVCAQGDLNVGDLTDPLYATVSFEPISVARKTTFEFVLSSVSDSPQGTALKVPLYEDHGGGAPGGVVAGYLYFGQPAQR